MLITEKEIATSEWFKSLRDKICAEFEKIEEEYLLQNPDFSDHQKSNINFYRTPQKFTRKKWQRDVANQGGSSADGGGGEISAMKGNVFEKVGVNISTVFGEFSPEFRGQIPGTENNPRFFATGVSLVAHMASPLVPAVHMNTRFIHTEKEWFGGGADLNPMFEVEADTCDFHQAFKKACDAYDTSLAQEIIDNDDKNSAKNFGKNSSYSSYEKFKKECDEYFFIKHRGVARGVGGIFYDYLNGGNADKSFAHLNNNKFSQASNKSAQESPNNSNKSFAKDFNFTKNVGLTFLEIFPQLVRRNMLKHWTEAQREHQLRKRGLYTEFNLVYDRGTKFGLMTGGNPEAILMSLPPIAKWD